MNIISATRMQIVLHPSKRDENWRAFIFDIEIIPDKPTPKKIVIQKKLVLIFFLGQCLGLNS